MGWARAMRGDNDYPVTISSSFFNVEQFQPFGTLQQGIPFIASPNVSSGRVPLARAAGFAFPEVGNVDRGYVQTWNVAFERRLPLDGTADIPPLGAKGTGGSPRVHIHPPTAPPGPPA